MQTETKPETTVALDPNCRFSTFCEADDLSGWDCRLCGCHSRLIDDDELSSAAATTDPLRGQAILVRDLRQTVAGLRDELSQRRQQWEEQNASLIAQARGAEQELAAQETRLREMGLERFQETGDKKPGFGVEVKMFSEPRYEQDQALEWAVEHKLALTLDKKAFEGIAKHGAIPFVRFEQVYRAQIASDLSKALEGE
mgnify:CR=1 FL=1